MIKTKDLIALTMSWAIAILGIVLLAGSVGSAQDKPKSETIQAQAMGRARATGRTFNITIRINSYSTPEDQKKLIDAFTGGGHDALVKTLSKMKSRGRVGITGTLGYEIAYIRTIPTENGRIIRIITDRPIQFAESYENTRSSDYDLSAIEIRIANEQKNSEGALIVAGKFKIDKDKQIVLESYGDSWRLTNIMERD